MTTELKDKYIKKVQKLACGRSIKIPSYGIIHAYRNSKGSRVFSLSKSFKNIPFPPGGNLSLKVVCEDISWL